MEKIKMRKIVKGIMFVVVLFSLPSISRAVVVHNVAKTVHNLGSSGVGGLVTTETTEICIFCHTPHNAVAGKTFLWNRQPDGYSPGTFMLYTASRTLNFAKGAVAISEVSKMCMSCHDGATAMNSMANPRAPTFTNKISDAYDPGFLGTELGPNIGGFDPVALTGGGDLTNDHPISFLYSDSSTGDPTIRVADVPGISIGGLPLWEGKVECVTCHDPHIYYGNPGGRSYGQQFCDGIGDCSLAPFLRKSNSSSALCFTCHNK